MTVFSAFFEVLNVDETILEFFEIGVYILWFVDFFDAWMGDIADEFYSVA